MLSGSALEALKEFYAERDAKEKELENLKAKKNTGDILSMDTFTENWNDSQFWVCSPPNLPTIVHS
jgi:cyclophilin family peptidyl-prolyl cis-trans isomerase